MQTLEFFAGAASSEADLEAVRSASPALHATAALMLLLAAAGLSIYKPRGLTRYGWRQQQKSLRASSAVIDSRD